MRKQISEEGQATVLLRSRRRCCICFGINRDTQVKPGQIAHLDGNPANNHLNNLVFLCLEHHDIFDSRTSQTKNFTRGEVEAFRGELSAALDAAFAQPRQFGQAVGAQATLSSVDGRYIRIETSNSRSAEIAISRIAGKNNQYYVSGFATYGRNREYGPSSGNFEYILEMTGENKFINRVRHYSQDYYEISIIIAGHSLSVAETNSGGFFGMGVYCSGRYLRAS